MIDTELTPAALPPHMRQRVRVSTAGCWEWTGPMNRSTGYGSCYSVEDGLKLTHRAAYEALVGPIPDGMEVDHLCRNRACCNPAHLEPVTHGVNMRRVFLSRPTCRSGRHLMVDGNVFFRASRRRAPSRCCVACYTESQRRARANRPTTRAGRAARRAVQA